jgi:large-conductance mechanosensitive channel
MKGRQVTVLLDADDVVREQVSGFVNFVREHAIVGLAVGFIVGQQAQGVVKQLVSSFIDPTLNLLIGQKLADLKFTVHLGDHSGTYPWGAMIVVLLNLLFVLVAMYLLIKIFNLDKLDKKKA